MEQSEYVFELSIFRIAEKKNKQAVIGKGKCINYHDDLPSFYTLENEKLPRINLHKNHLLSIRLGSDRYLEVKRHEKLDKYLLDKPEHR